MGRPPKLQVPRKRRDGPPPPPAQRPPAPPPEEPAAPRRGSSAHSLLDLVEALALVIGAVTGVAAVVHEIGRAERPEPAGRPPVTVIILCQPRPDAPIEPAVPERGPCRPAVDPNASR